MTSYRVSLIRHQRRTFLLCEEKGMQKCVRMRTALHVSPAAGMMLFYVLPSESVLILFYHAWVLRT